MCNCASEVEAKAKEQILTKLPTGARGLSVELQGFVFLLSNGVSMKNKMNMHIEYEAPKKNGDFARKKQDMSMIGSYCMFCGEKYDKAEATA